MWVKASKWGQVQTGGKVRVKWHDGCRVGEVAGRRSATGAEVKLVDNQGSLMVPNLASLEVWKEEKKFR